MAIFVLHYFLAPLDLLWPTRDSILSDTSKYETDRRGPDLQPFLRALSSLGEAASEDTTPSNIPFNQQKQHHFPREIGFFKPSTPFFNRPGHDAPQLIPPVRNHGAIHRIEHQTLVSDPWMTAGQVSQHVEQGACRTRLSGKVCTSVHIWQPTGTVRRVAQGDRCSDRAI